MIRFLPLMVSVGGKTKVDGCTPNWASALCVCVAHNEKRGLSPADWYICALPAQAPACCCASVRFMRVCTMTFAQIQLLELDVDVFGVLSASFAMPLRKFT